MSVGTGAGTGETGCTLARAAPALALFTRSGVVGVRADGGLDADAGVLGLGFDLDLDLGLDLDLD